MSFSFDTTMYIKDGQLLLRNRKQLDALALASGYAEFDVIIENKKRKRSLDLNRYYWGVVVAMVKDAFIELGHDIDSKLTHEFLKQRCNYKEFIDFKTGEVIKLPQSTTDITNTQFMEYVERIKQFASETLDVYIPDPNEQMTLL